LLNEKLLFLFEINGNGGHGGNGGSNDEFRFLIHTRTGLANLICENPDIFFVFLVSNETMLIIKE